MRFKLVMNCDNATFGEEGDGFARRAEVARLLVWAAKKIRGGADEVYLRDEIGNHIGTAKFDES